MRTMLAGIVCLFVLSVTSVYPQGLETTATKGDWEEINFAFDRDVLTDGYPSLLRLAELLSANPGYRVRLEGHADSLGSDAYNIQLSNRRAQTVKDFLVKYGASEGQIAIEPRGEGAPKVTNETREGRWMNRRVRLTVTDAQGNVISDGGIDEAIDNISELIQKQEECCDKILRKLDKLDEILAALENLRGENQQLKDEIADLRKAHEGLKGDVTELAAAPKPPTSDEISARVSEVVKEAVPKPSDKFSVLNLNIGPDTDDGNVSATAKGRVFLPFAKRHAVQAEGEYLHYFGRDEGQVDLGLVNRFGNIQAGAFSSFKYVKLDDFQSAGALGQASGTLDYVFNRGRVGVYGTKGFMDGSVVNSILLGPNLVEESYLQILDQVGFSTTMAAWGNTWFEGNVGAILRKSGDDKAGGTIRYIHPITRSLAFTAEAGLNETLISDNNTGRVVFGLQFGGWLNPRDYAQHTDRPVPVEIPRVRYEVLKRQVRTGNDQPVADAGPDQIGIEAGPVMLDGSGSFDPDDDPITFAWEQVGGPAVQLSGADSAQAGFTAEEGQTYHFRLMVRDDRNGVSTDRVTVSTLDRQIRIRRFTADPTRIDRGEVVTLVWEVENATEVEITGLGSVDPQAGSSTVSPTETTSYRLVARNPKSEVSQTVTVTVSPLDSPQILNFFASPSRITQGEAARLTWDVKNADQVTISSIGPVSLSGSSDVMPDETTTYTLTATNEAGEATATAILTVVPAGMEGQVKIVEFVAEPPIARIPGDPVVLRWETENAEQVVITGIGEVEASGSVTVNPLHQTTYTLNAIGGGGEVTAVVIVRIENENRAPAAVALGGPLKFGDGNITTVTLDGRNSSDPDDDPITYMWRSIGTLEAEITNPTSARPTVRLKGGEGAYLFELEVTDDKGLRSFDTVTVKVADL